MAYRTKQRRLILKCLTDRADEHVTAADIVASLRRDGTEVGTATVYRFLDTLLAEGKVRRYAGEDGACFQWIGDGECRRHYHFVCSKCGSLYHIHCESLDGLCSHIRTEHGFCVDLSQTVFCGVCAKCAEAQS